MRTPASIKRHPVHPMLITLPIGLLIFSLISDIIFLANWGPPVWRSVALYTLGGGIITALIAAIPGLIDYTWLAPGKVKNTATKHLILNLSMVAVFVVDFWIRWQNPASRGVPFTLSIVGVLILFYAGWLGADLVHEHHVTVSEEQQKPATIVDYRKAA